MKSKFTINIVFVADPTTAPIQSSHLMQRIQDVLVAELGDTITTYKSNPPVTVTVDEVPDDIEGKEITSET
jgi:hypothetical protein